MKLKTLCLIGLLFIVGIIIGLLLREKRTLFKSHEDRQTVFLENKETNDLFNISQVQKDEVKRDEETHPYRLRNGYEILPDPDGLPRIDMSNIPQRIFDAIDHGAIGKVTLRIVDTMDKPVSDAHVEASFFNNDNPIRIIKSDSDHSGLISLENTCVGDMNFHVTKQGYYKTTMRYWFSITDYDCVRDGRWQPWNPIIKVVLKEKREPTPMFVKRLQKTIPKAETTAGIDFEIGDLVHPNGKGVIADLIIRYKIEYGEDSLSWRAETIYEMPNGSDGFYTCKKDDFSQLKSPYRANTDTYFRCMTNVFERTRGKIIIDTRNKEDDIFVFKIRTARHEPMYGKMLLPNRLIDLTYYLNPIKGDTNLEFDGKNNLFKPGRNEDWPREP